MASQSEFEAERELLWQREWCQHIDVLVHALEAGCSLLFGKLDWIVRELRVCNRDLVANTQPTKHRRTQIDRLPIDHCNASVRDIAGLLSNPVLLYISLDS